MESDRLAAAFENDGGDRLAWAAARSREGLLVWARASRGWLRTPAARGPDGSRDRRTICGDPVGRGERASPSVTQQSLRFVMINRTPRDLLPARARSA
jgi:hypothetical protein